jgi:hypothetical protein
MIRYALRFSHERKGRRSIEVGAMDTAGEPVLPGFEMVEGIEMVPGTVHLVDSEFTVRRKSVEDFNIDASDNSLFSARS